MEISKDECMGWAFKLIAENDTIEKLDTTEGFNMLAHLKADIEFVGIDLNYDNPRFVFLSSDSCKYWRDRMNTLVNVKYLGMCAFPREEL